MNSYGVLPQYKDYFLICRLTGTNLWGPAKGMKNFPWEKPEKVAARELEEETNIKVNPEELDFLCEYEGTRRKNIIFHKKLDAVPMNIKCNSIVPFRGFPEIDAFYWIRKWNAVWYFKNTFGMSLLHL